MTDDYHFCDLCGLNRATLHLDEVVKSEIQASAHLCDDCWYRLGVRVPLGNIWKHIENQQRSLNLQGDVPLDDIEPDDLQDFLKDTDDEDLGELFDSGDVGIAEPTRSDRAGIPPFEDPLLGDDDRSDRIPLDPLTEGALEDPIPVGETHASLVSLVPLAMLEDCKAVPIRLEGTHVTIAIADPGDTIAIASLESYIEKQGLTCYVVHGDEFDIMRELARHEEPPPLFDSLS